MARAPQVTRTIKSTKALVKGVDLNTDTMVNLEFNLPRTYATDEAIKKAIAKVHHNPDIQIVKVMRTEVQENLYAMSEADFIAAAHIVQK